MTGVRWMTGHGSEPNWPKQGAGSGIRANLHRLGASMD